MPKVFLADATSATSISSTTPLKTQSPVAKSSTHTKVSHTSSLASTSSASAHATAAPANGGLIALGVILGLVGLIMFAVYFFLRRRRLRASEGYDDTAALNPKVADHPASRITPFGAETPRFTHTPGANMRVAIRRPDGSWRFDDPQSSYVPSASADLDLLSPSSATPSLRRFPSSKEEEARQERSKYISYASEIHPPPPAYVQHE